MSIKLIATCDKCHKDKKWLDLIDLKATSSEKIEVYHLCEDCYGEVRKLIITLRGS